MKKFKTIIAAALIVLPVLLMLVGWMFYVATMIDGFWVVPAMISPFLFIRLGIWMIEKYELKIED